MTTASESLAPRAVLRPLVPAMVAAAGLRRKATPLQRAAAAVALVTLWSAVYHRYQKAGRAQTRAEWEALRTASPEALSRHYNERVPSVEEEFEMWGDFHRHRHEMRYDLVAAAVREHLRPGGTVLDVGCGAGLVAERIADMDATYIGLEYTGHILEATAKKFAGSVGRLRARFVRGDAERLPLAAATVDVVVMSEVIEHLVRPELAVWQVSRVLRPGGIYLMTTNNASEMPCRSPATHIYAWLEKALGAHRPEMISLRPWVWPQPVDPELLAEGTRQVWLPHTHHIYEETRRLFAAAGLDTFRWATFEFPPPQSATDRWLEARGELGRRAVDLVEAMCRSLPLVERLGSHLFMHARKAGPPVAEHPPPRIWRGPFSGDPR